MSWKVSSFSLCFLVLLANSQSLGQTTVFTMSNATVTACADENSVYSFFDDEEQEPYSDGSYTMTICPDDENDALIVQFYAFSLFQSAVNGQSDVLSIFDGPNTSSPSLGSYTGDDLQGITISATSSNDGGCLTFVFNVNTGSGGSVFLNGWEAEVTCGTPCETPFADGQILSEFEEIDGIPIIKLCIGESATFGDEGSNVPSGLFEIEEYIWDWGDGTVDTLNSASNATHTFNDAGAYNVDFSVSYFNGTNDCVSLNLEPMVVWVSTPAQFNTEVLSPICVGPGSFSAEVDASPVASDLWTDAPSFDAPSIASTGFGAGVTYTSEITFNFFEPDATLEDCDDLIAIHAAMEHSYLGDLDIFIECPNGTQVLLQDQEGGGIFLGEPVDVEADFTEGLCYDYGWQEGSTLGTLDQGPTTFTNYTNTNGMAASGNILDPGLYTPYESLCDLVGCPLNGTWQLGFTDMLALDNGFMCTWSLEFDPSLLPGVTVIQPQIEYLNWDFTSISSDDLEITVNPSDSAFLDIQAFEAGVYQIGLEVENDFGCSADTTLEVVVFDPIEVSAGGDQIFCSTGATLTGSVVFDPSEGNCDNDGGEYSYCYASNDNTAFTYCPDDLGLGAKMVISFSAGEMAAGDQIVVYDGSDTSAPILGSVSGDLTGETFVATNNDGCITLAFSSDWWTDCQFGAMPQAEWCVSCLGGSDCAFNWDWTPSVDLATPNANQSAVNSFSGQPTEYTLSVYPDGYPGCVGSDVVQVLPGFEYTVEFEQPSCLLNDGEISVEITEDPANGPWSIYLTSGGTLLYSVNSNGGLETFDNLVPDDYHLEVSGDACLYEFDIVLEDPPALTLEVSADTTICIDGTAVMQVWSEMDPDQNWIYTWDNGLGTGMTKSVNPAASATYSVSAVDEDNCPSETESIEVFVQDSLSIQGFLGADLICTGAAAQLQVEGSDGGSGLGYAYDWDWQNIPVGADDTELTHYPSSTGTYCVTLTDNCETPPITECFEVVVETPMPPTYSVDTARACVPGVIQFTLENDTSEVQSQFWFFGDGEGSSNQDPAHAYMEPGSYDLTLEITSNLGCTYTATFDGAIDIFTPPSVGFTASPQPATAPDTEIEFESVNSSNVVGWFWQFDTVSDLGVSMQENPIFKFPIDRGGLYPVTLVVTDENGCSNQVTRYVEIFDLYNLFIPTSFTPNNDGVNDAFKIEGTDIDPDRFLLQVFDRWGSKVFETTDPQAVWHGPASGDSEYFVQDNLYTYRVIVYSLSLSGNRREITGYVTVLR